jgi:hypothetical protein
MRVARPEQFRVHADLAQRLAGDLARRRFPRALYERSERDRVADRHARVQRGIGILKHHLHLAAQRIDRDPVRRADRVAVEHQFPAIRHEQVQQQPCQGRFSAPRLADHAQRLAFPDVERDAVDRLDRLAAGPLDRKMLFQIAHDQHRLQRAAAVARIDQTIKHQILPRAASIPSHLPRYIRTSIAARSPSLTRLKQTDVMKIATPGSAQTTGTT